MNIGCQRGYHQAADGRREKIDTGDRDYESHLSGWDSDVPLKCVLAPPEDDYADESDDPAASDDDDDEEDGE